MPLPTYNDNPKRRTPFARQPNPGRLVPTAATTRVLLGIQTHEGVLSQRQIRQCFFPDCTSTWPEARLLHYYDHRLLNKFDASFVNGEQLGEIVYTLDATGARTRWLFHSEKAQPYIGGQDGGVGLFGGD